MVQKSSNKRDNFSRSCKISNALKKALVDEIMNKGLSIRKAAFKYKLNYSSAKVIYRSYRIELHKSEGKKRRKMEERQMEFREEYRKQRKQFNRCKYREEVSEEMKERSESTEIVVRRRIQVISTVSWNFLKDGLPQQVPF